MGIENVNNNLIPNWNSTVPSIPAGVDNSSWNLFGTTIPNFNFTGNEPLFNYQMPAMDSFGLNNFNFSMPQMNFNNADWQAGLNQAVQMQDEYVNNYLENMKAMFAKMMPNTPPNNPQNPGNNANYGNYNFDVSTTKYEGKAKDLNKHLDGVLKGKGKTLLALQEKYGINAAFLAALVNHESANGKSNAALNKNNVAGIMSVESGYSELRTFSSVDECLEYVAKLLSQSYISQGLTTISQIHSKYCPIGADNDPTGLNANWGSSISALTNEYMAAA